MKRILLVVCLLLLSGCTDYVEINDLAIITGIAIDYNNDMFDITTQLIINEKESTIKIYNTKSKSIEEALAKISKLCNKNVFISDLKTLIITENIIKNNINYYDYFLRNSKSKMNFYVYLVDSNISKEILELYKNVDGSSLYADKLMKFNERIFSSSTPLMFIDLVKYNLEKGINPVYPTLSIQENSEEKVLYLDNLITFNSNKEKIILNENESIIYNMLTNQLNSTSLVFDCDENIFSLKVEKSETKYDFNNNTFIINVEVSSKIENYKCTYDLEDDNTIDKLIKISNNKIRKDVENILSLAKDNNNDFLGIGKYIYKHYPKYYDFENSNWDESINNLDIKLNTKMSILSSGEIRKSIGDKNGKNE